MAEKSNVATAPSAQSISASGAVVGAELAWFLLFPSLGLLQRYLGTTATFACFIVGFLLLVALGMRGWPAALERQGRDRRWISVTLVALYAVLMSAFVILYPLSNSHARPSIVHAAVEGGSDRDESLNLGVRELLAGRYPYYQTTQLQNPVTQLPGSLILAIPFALLGNAAWQNLFWLAAFFGIVRHVFGHNRLAAGVIALTMFGCPVALQDFVTGGDLGVNAITILIGMFLMVTFAADASTARWKTIGAAAFTGIALSSRLNYLLLVPPLIAAIARRASLTEAFTGLLVIGFAFGAVTLPFYLHDPAGFAPLYLHNKFSQFDGEVRNAGILFPSLSLLFSVAVSWYPDHHAVRGWLIQSGLVLTLPVVFLVALAADRLHAPNFMFADYALPGVFFGGLGAGMMLLRGSLVHRPAPSISREVQRLLVKG